jgi:hypothetical protein
MELDVRGRILTVAIRVDRLGVAAHVGVIHVAEQTQCHGRLRTQFHFDILATRSRDVPVEGDAIGHGRHQRFSTAHGVARRDVFDDDGVGVAARVSGVVVSAVVVHRPVGELEMTVGADGVGIKEIDDPQLARADLKAACRELRLQREWRRRGGLHLLG